MSSHVTMPHTVYALPRSMPETQGVDGGRMAQAFAYVAARFPAWRELMVLRRGQVIAERINRRPYIVPNVWMTKALLAVMTRFSRAARPTLRDRFGAGWNTRSIAKSVLSALTGLVLAQNRLFSLDDSLLDFFPATLTADLEPEKRAITLRHLLTMSSGLRSVENGPPMLQFLNSADWLRFALHLPLDDQPGARFLYNSANTHLLAAVLTHVTGQNLLAFANRYLFGPLGISGAYWATDPQGICFGGGNLFLTAEDLARFGLLYLQRGVWQGRELVPTTWVDESLRPYQTAEHGFRYGYFWWLKDEVDGASGQAHFSFSASGAGGQKVYVIPDRELVVVALSHTRFAGSQDQVLNEMIGQYILPAVKD